MKRAFLIKRNIDFTDKKVMIKRRDKNKGFIDTNLRSRPLSHKFKIGDLIYVYETRNGIWAKGEVKKINDIIWFETIGQIIDHYYTDKKTDSAYYFALVQKLYQAQKNNTNASLYYHKYFIDQKLLDRVIPLTKCLKDLEGRLPIRQLNNEQIEYLKNPEFIEENELSSKIPSRLRMDLYSLFNTKLKLSHVIDIDHFVPKSCGGPGNIIENLLPIGFSLNRYKSNSVPAGLFEVAKKYKKLKKYCRNNYSEKNKSGFIRNDTNAFENALKINQYIAGLHISEAKLFYKSVMQKHYPEYVKIINKF